jgi:hypothetical protein
MNVAVADVTKLLVMLLLLLLRLLWSSTVARWG